MKKIVNFFPADATFRKLHVINCYTDHILSQSIGSKIEVYEKFWT